MAAHNTIEEIFFKFLTLYEFEENDLDYTVLQKHTSSLQNLVNIGNSGFSVFDVSKRQTVFYSSNFGHLLGYTIADYQTTGQYFFASKIHPDDVLECSLNGVSILKIFNAFTSEEKLAHKVISEYRMLNAQNKYIRLIEQYQILELDKQGHIWLLLSVIDISPNQEEFTVTKNQLYNFKNGNIIPMETASKAQFNLTKREIEILKLVKNGLLSKEISDKLSISLHTVNTHRQRFLEKLGANNSTEAVLFASRFGLLT